MSYRNLTDADGTELAMETTRLSSKGQIILPKSIRTLHHWEPGVEFEVKDTGNGVLLRPLRSSPPSKLADVVGCTGYQGPRRSLQDMDAAIAKGLKARRGRN